jgi:hypothetical protein
MLRMTLWIVLIAIPEDRHSLLCPNRLKGRVSEIKAVRVETDMARP